MSMEITNSSSEGNTSSNKWDDIYSKPENLVEIRLLNRTNTIKYVWIEPAAYSLELDANTEYKFVTDDKSFLIEYDSDNQITLCTDSSFGFKLYKRENRSVSNEWVLDIDLSHIN